MAKRNYLVEGLSGTGKSSVYEELIGRGYMAISTDRAWAYHADPDTALPGGPVRHDTHRWHEQKAVGELESPEPEVLFVCGSSRNRDRFLPYFTRVFNLRIDEDTMRRRLEPRTEDDWPLGQEGVELMLALNRSDEKPPGAIDIDATRPLQQVVDELLRLADCKTAGSDSKPAPWSKRGSPIGRSFVIPETQLRSVQAAGARGGSDEFAAVLDRQSITCLEYSWSGGVLATLLPYLVEQGIDLMHSDHAEAAATIAQSHEGSVYVLTPAHRARYLARLDPSTFDGALLRRHYEELNGTTAVGVDYAMLDGVAFLRDTLAPLRSAVVGVLIIG